jgi:DNA-binding transcriptional MerR regulator
MRTWSISELSKAFEITPRTIRFYEDKGLLSPDRDGNTRIYASRDRTRLKLILRGRRIGFSLDDIAEILSLYDPGENQKQLEHLIAKIDSKKNRLASQLEDIHSLMNELESVRLRCYEDLERIRLSARNPSK